MDLLEKLKKGRSEMRERCERIGELLRIEAGVYEIQWRKSLTGRAWPYRNKISAPRPLTRRSLYIFAHECAHVALKHDSKSKTRHREEYEAEQWATAALRRHGVAVPRKETTGAKKYVARKIRQAVKRGAKSIDREALNFAGRYAPRLECSVAKIRMK